MLQSMIPCDRLLLDGNKAILLVGGFWTPMLVASYARIASPFFWVLENELSADDRTFLFGMQG